LFQRLDHVMEALDGELKAARHGLGREETNLASYSEQLARSFGHDEALLDAHRELARIERKLTGQAGKSGPPGAVLTNLEIAAIAAAASRWMAGVRHSGAVRPATICMSVLLLFNPRGERMHDRHGAMLAAERVTQRDGRPYPGDTSEGSRATATRTAVSAAYLKANVHVCCVIPRLNRVEAVLAAICSEHQQPARSAFETAAALLRSAGIS